MAKPSVQAEFRSMSTTTSELEWLLNLMDDFYLPSPLAIDLYFDNKATMHISTNPIFYERTKFLCIDCHYTRDKGLERFIQTSHVSSREQLADIMIK